MPATVGQSETALQYAVDFVYDALVTNRVADNSNAVAVLTNYSGDEKQELLAAIEGQRKVSVDSITAHGRALVGRALLDWVHAAGVTAPFTSVNDDLFVTLRQYYDDVGTFAGGSVDKKVTGRGWTRGTPSVGSYNWTISRITVDEYGQAIETGNPQVVRIVNRSLAADTRKVVVFTPGDAGRDIFDIQGPGGQTAEMTLFGPGASDGLLNTPFFSLASGVTSIAAGTPAAGTSGLPNWTVSGTWTNNTTNLLNLLGAPLTCGVKTSTANDYIQQIIPRAADRRRPYQLCLWVYPAAGFNAASGTVVVTWGSKSQTFSSLTDSQWNLLKVTADVNCYPEQWDSPASGANIVKVLVGVASVGLTIGMVQMVPMQKVFGTWYAGTEGKTAAAPVSPVVNAVATVTDTWSIAGKIQHVLGVLWPDLQEAYLTTTGTNTLADP